MPFQPTDRCRECGANIARSGIFWRDICGAISCLMSGHAHEPWPEVMYQEREVSPGVFAMAVRPSVN